MSLFDKLNPQYQAPQTGNPVIDMFGNFNNFQQQFSQFANQMGNTNPQQAVQSLLSSGRMSQDQFNRLSRMANMITGRRQF